MIPAALAANPSLDRWVRFDPQGYLDLYAPDVTYFDPNVTKRVDGLEAMKALLAPSKELEAAIKDARYEMTDARIQRHGDVALLTFNLVNYGRVGDRPERALTRWNATEVYRSIEGRWRIVHSHWSYVKPLLRPEGS